MFVNINAEVEVAPIEKALTILQKSNIIIPATEKKLSRQRELSNDLTKLDSRGRSSSDEVAVYSSEQAMELNGRLHISLDSNRLTN